MGALEVESYYLKNLVFSPCPRLYKVGLGPAQQWREAGPHLCPTPGTNPSTSRPREDISGGLREPVWRCTLKFLKPSFPNQGTE